MIINLRINNNQHEIEISPGDSLLKVVRSLGYHSIKFGDEHGLTGSDTVLMDGVPVNAGIMLAAQAEGHKIVTLEALGEHPEQGWKESQGLHPLQEAFVETGAIQCGYCTPGQILAAKELLDRKPNPTEGEVRDALSGVLCRCTGYKKPVQAVLRAAAVLRGEDLPPLAGTMPAPPEWTAGPGEPSSTDGEWPVGSDPSPAGAVDLFQKVMPKISLATESDAWQQVGKPEPKVDAVKLTQGKPAFVADYEKRDTLIAKILHSPHAHARITHIDASKARELPGVAAVLTHKDLPRVAYSTAGQSDPIPGPLDCFSLDNKVRFVGDRVAFVAAETAEIAEEALGLIDVEYEILEPILDVREAMKPGAPIIHDEPDYVDFADSDPERNLAAEIRIDIGDVEAGFAEADRIFEHEYVVPKVQQAHIEPHVVLTYWDEDDRMVIRTSTQVPFHVRRMIAPVLGLPVKRIRVIKPRIGGGFGGKQEMLIEDVAAHLTIATGRPVLCEYTREEEFIASRSRHPMRVRLKTGVKEDGTITANSMYALSDTGANGAHALTVTGNTGHKSMALYVGDGPYRESPNIRFYADIVYTNTPPSGAYRGYGVPQGYWPVERQIETIVQELGFDPLEFRLKNTLRAGELHPFSTAWSEGREPVPETIVTNELPECVQQGKAAIGWDQKYGDEDWQQVPGQPHLRQGIGVATIMQGTAIPYLDMGGASLKLNDDGSFNLLIGATDLGTGSDTVLAQMAAEVLGVNVDDIIVYSSDTDFTPFDKGAYASSTTYISGGAVVDAAEKVAGRLKERAVMLLNEVELFDPVEAEEIELRQGQAVSPDGRAVSLAKIALHSLHHADQEQIMAVGSYMSPVSPPPFAAQFAEVTVDVETGQLVVDRLVMAVDAGVIVNPVTASGQVEGGMVQALGYAVSEEMVYDDEGHPREVDFRDYHIFRADEMPELEVIFVEVFEPSHPFGVKAVAEIPMNGVAPAVGNAVFNACGAAISDNPVTPEKVWRALRS
ncbi:MAG: putative xanthine dehydrogenase molybdenum-binding subunit XdhA [Chloroflexi bacterium]|nr:putative xanthine dehydrogenase molybdenum-binding subunit XdhA [Chloroflexota bacterium]